MIVVGVDPHKKSHTAVAVDASTGQLVGELSVPARRRGHERLLSWARALDPEVRVALEDCRHVSGALEALLLKSGVAVVRVPPRLMGQARRGQRTRGKSDPIDAAAVARAALAHPDLPVAQMAGPDREIRLLVDHREDLVAERTRIQSRLRWRLHELDPELSIPLRALNRRKWLEAATRRLDELGPSLQARLAGAELERCVALTASIDALERELEARVSAEAPELLALPGCGPLTAAKLVGEIAGVERFATPARLAMNAGVAPLPVSSGARQRHRLNRQGNRQLNCALHRLAVNQGRLHQPAREYLARKESEGHSRREALRALKRHLVNVVWRLLVSTASDDQLKAGAPSIAPALT
jgi:transposase